MKKLILLILFILPAILMYAQIAPISFQNADVKPEYPGGQQALLKYLAENTKYPEEAKENKIEGRVFVKFVIDHNGSVTNVGIAKKVDDLLDKEALRVVNSLPDWEPGKKDGQTVPVSYIVPLNFQLDNEEEKEGKE